MDPERKRIAEKTGDTSPWEHWGPYVAERSWGVVREDYSEEGDAWTYFTHDHARVKTFRWGEDGIAGLCDRYQVFVLNWAFWNGKDPFLKERLFGVSSAEGNHGEDVKEFYFHLDNTPTHSYMKYLYKYPIDQFPYEKLIEENGKRSLADQEYELADTGVMDGGRYFDIEIEYAKKDAEDICIRLTVSNRSSEAASLHFLPQLIFRNTWSWHEQRTPQPEIVLGDDGALIFDDEKSQPLERLNFIYRVGKHYFYGDPGGDPLFTDNESNQQFLDGGDDLSPYTKDAFHRHITQGEECTNPKKEGTKAGLHYLIAVPAGESKTFRFRMSLCELKDPLADVDKVFAERIKEADKFYSSVHPKGATEEEKMIQRQALSGMLWNKQIYLFDVNSWLKGDNPNHPPPENHARIRNLHWRHLISKRILSMPDKWEYPWFAAWDLAFHCVSFGLVDMEFAKSELYYLLFDQFQHPNGQVPAYEWEFSDLNPPVQAWAAYRLFKMEHRQTGKKDYAFLKKCFHKLMINFVWWVNKVDSKGNNVFEGGFLGLDNITVIDRSEEIPGGGHLEQSDGTGWMGFFCLLLMRISLELSKVDMDYAPLATKFFQHFIYIGHALRHSESRDVQLWDDEDGFFYDVLSYPDGRCERIKVRSLVGLIPMFAIDELTDDDFNRCPDFARNFQWFTTNREELTKGCVTKIEREGTTHYMLSLMNYEQMQRILTRAWDPEEFRSEYGLRSLSKHYAGAPYELLGKRITYEPGEAECVLKGGNSNWRGPLWFPTTYLFVEALRRIHSIVGDDLKIRVGQEEPVTTYQMAEYYAKGMIRLFKENPDGTRPIYTDYPLHNDDPHFKDLILFFEHFHGDSGRGLGASHQTGWTGLVANFISEYIT